MATLQVGQDEPRDSRILSSTMASTMSDMRGDILFLRYWCSRDFGLDDILFFR